MRPFSDIMVFLPYTPRADAEARGYDEWLRRVDNPFFNSIPGIAHYSNWKVTGGAPDSNWKVTGGAPAGFTHFDFMYLDPALADQVWTNETLLDFAAGWTEQWGREPQATDLSVNYHSYRLAKVSGPSLFDPRGVRLASSAAAVPTIGGAVWKVSEAMVGTSPLPFHEFAFGPIAAEGALGGIAGTLIAAPED